MINQNDAVAGLIIKFGIGGEELKENNDTPSGEKPNQKIKTTTNESDNIPYPSLNKYATNLNELAGLGKLNHLIGREKEIRRILQEWLVTNIKKINNHKPYWLLVNLKIGDFYNDKKILLEEFQNLMLKSRLIK